MTPIPSDEAKALFLEVLDLPEDERRRVLHERAGSRSALRAEVEALLADDARAEGFLEPPPLPRPPDHDAEARWLEGRRIGRYALQRRIGMGGMGTVYEAVQDKPRRRVAIKLLRTGVVTPQLLRRFELEAEILGRLRHPGIAEIYEAGTHESELGPIPFFALEFVADARSLTRYAEEEQLDVPARLRLLASVCDAVHHAHQAGVIHRDIKPSNVLVGADGRPRLIDFGVARATDDERGITLGTQLGELVGTLCYMSPEQCAGDAAEVDARTDVYALGVLAYEVLTGRLPYPVERASAFAVTELVRNHVPRPPSVRGAARARDVDAVVLRALEKQPRRRYDSARALAEDLRRASEGQPVLAAKSRRAYALRVLAWRSRHALPMLAAVAATGIGAWALTRSMAGDERMAAGDSRPVEATPATDGGTAAEASDPSDREAYRTHVAEAEQALVAHEPARARAALERCEPALRGFEWDRLHALADGSAQVLAVGSPVHALALDPGTGTLVAVSEDGELHAWQLEGSGRPPRLVPRWTRPTGDSFVALAIDPVAGVVYTGGDRMFVQAFDLRDGQPRGSFASGPGSIWSLAVTGEPAHLVIARQGGTAERWDLAAREQVYAHAITTRLGEVELADDAFFVAVSTGVSARSLATAKELRSFVTPEQPEAILVGDAELWAAGWENRIFAFDRTSGARRELPEQPGGILDLARVDASTVASAGRDGAIVLWDVARGIPLRTLRGHDHGVEALVVGDAGAWLASASLDGTVRTWDLHAPPTELALPGLRDKVHDVAFVDEGRGLVAASGPHWDALDEDVIVRWSLPDGRILATAEDHATTVDVIEASPRADVLASAARNGEVVVRDAEDLEPRLRIASTHVGRVTALAFSPDGTRLGTAGHDGTLATWDVGDGRLLARLDLEHGPVDDALWTVAGLHAAVDGDLVRWSGIAGEPVALVATSTAAGVPIRRIAALPGASFVVGGDDGTIARLEPGRDAPQWLRPTFGRAVTALAVTTDGERIAVSSQDQRIRLHDARTGTLLLTVGEHESTATAVAWSPDGATLASGGFDKLVRVWRSR